MTGKTDIPKDIDERLLHFQDEVKKHFYFLAEYGFKLDNGESGRTENFFDYYSKFYFKNGDTSVWISYSTDIIKGHTIKFPQVKQKPATDNLIHCSIADENAFMSVDCFAETRQPAIPKDNFSIRLNAKDIKAEITRVVSNYSDFFRDYLTDVLQRKKIFDCYTDRFYDKVFKEINYKR